MSSQHVDLLLHDALSGLDPEKTREALRDMQEAIGLQFAALARAKYRRRRVEAKCPGCQTRQKFTLPSADPEVVARAAAATAKAGDAYARLEQFLAGKPDSRAEDGREWLRALTGEQLAVVQGWIEQAARGGR